MSRSVYLIGGAGTGKSTLTATILQELKADLGPLEDLHALPNKKNVVTLRGHRFARGAGLYLGLMRDKFPGSDGLDRASSPVGEAWLQAGGLPSYIIGEGSTLATRRFLGALHEETHLLVLHLIASPEEKERRFARRGSHQAETFVTGTATRAKNLAQWCRDEGMVVADIDTEDPFSVDTASDLAIAWILNGDGE